MIVRTPGQRLPRDHPAGERAGPRPGDGSPLALDTPPIAERRRVQGPWPESG
ncbi:hypothetical protein HD597_001097 [Nonomuraea thailandensis]|uniref:Uncharacterized protein n=1 Tax=Nonomuraea thailandensis TaxID=1188745 RepID=A0A9X2G7P8_9ACTN|nr:hypothetical protein [Nonomuraea thailandensis]MCP2354077.1 hypothetical protein [Nonomuraea thailandensis]